MSEHTKEPWYASETDDGLIEIVNDERYRWLRNWTRGAYGIDSNPAFILPHVPTMLDQNIMSGSVAQHLDNAIDAAIERDNLKGGAA